MPSVGTMDTVELCFKFRDSKAAKEQVQQQSSGGSKKQWKKKGKANGAQEPASSTPSESAL